MLNDKVFYNCIKTTFLPKSFLPGDNDSFQFRQNQIRIFSQFSDNFQEVIENRVGNLFVAQPLHESRI